MSTNQAPPGPARAAARVGPPPPTMEPPRFMPRRRPGRIGAVSVIQLLVVEAVLVGVAMVFARYPVIGLIAMAMGVLALGLTFWRSQGRWWTETLSLHQQLHKRAGAPVVPDKDGRLTALRCLVPDLRVHTVEIANEELIGVGQDGSGWFAVAAVLPPEALRGATPTAVPVDALAQVLVEAGQPGTIVQVVTHTVPAAVFGGAAGQPGLESYRELLWQVGQVPPNDQSVWVSVRLDMQAVARAKLDGTESDDDIRVMVAMLARAMSKQLRRSGFRSTPLDRDGLLTALAHSCDLERYDPRQGRVGEDWYAWRSAGLSHSCFWVRDWPGLDNAGALLDAFAIAAAAYTSTALIVEPRESDIRLRCLVRAAAPDPMLAVARQSVLNLAHRCGATLFPLDGEQGPAVYASAPSGGGGG